MGYKIIDDLELQEQPHDGDYLIIGKNELHKIPFDYLGKELSSKATGVGIHFEINENGGLRISKVNKEE